MLNMSEFGCNSGKKHQNLVRKVQFWQIERKKAMENVQKCTKFWQRPLFWQTGFARGRIRKSEWLEVIFWPISAEFGIIYVSKFARNRSDYTNCYYSGVLFKSAEIRAGNIWPISVRFLERFLERLFDRFPSKNQISGTISGTISAP